LENCCDHTACRSDSSKEVQKISKAYAAWVIIYASERFAAKTLELSPKIFQADRSGHRWHLFWFCKLLFDWSLLTATPRSCRSMGTNDDMQVERCSGCRNHRPRNNFDLLEAPPPVTLSRKTL